MMAGATAPLNSMAFSVKRKLPDGIRTFRTLRAHGCCTVDKAPSVRIHWHGPGKFDYITAFAHGHDAMSKERAPCP